MKRFILLFAALGVMCQMSYAQTPMVSGQVVAADDGKPLVNVSVTVKGSPTGTLTDVEGNYSLPVPQGATLVFTFIGMNTEEAVVNGQTLNMRMTVNSIAIDEVVVTAMGVQTEKKRLNFAVQNVNADQLTEGNFINFTTALQGKIAGVNVTSAGGSPNSGSQLIIRGISSVNPSQNNQPLFVLDGMPISANAASAADFNPNDIASVTVLKGAAASALYGQEAANGAIMITTKQGAAGKLTVSANASLQIDLPAQLLETQSKYAPGALGFYKEKTGGGWGPLLDADVERYDNVKNFFQNGFYHKYDVNLTGGTEKFQAYASANYSKADGIVPNDYLQRTGVLVKGSYKISKMLSVTLMANMSNKKYRSAGSISSIYSWPVNDDIRDYKNGDGSVRFRYLADKKEDSPVSPLWSRYMDSGVNSSTRNLLQGSISFKPLKGWEIIGRVSYDLSHTSYDGYSVPRFDDMEILDFSDPTKPYFTADELASVKDRSIFGEYVYNSSASSLLNMNIMSTYHLDLPQEFGLDFLAGAEAKMRESRSGHAAGRDFISPGIYSLSNVKEQVIGTDVYLSHSRRRIAGAYGELRADYKGVATLSGTVRWDWSSTIERTFNPYFYPSVTGGVIFSELFDIAGEVFSYGKVRGNYAMVGKDAPFGLFDRKYMQYTSLPDGGYALNSTLSVGMDIVPEVSKSWEVGLDLRFFNSKTRLDVAYYSTQTDNQIVTVRVSHAAGHVLVTRNEGNVRNQGVELTLEQDIIKNNTVSWTAALNFGLNRGKLVGLPEGMYEIQGTQYGDIFPSAVLNESTTAVAGSDYLRTDDGQVICDANGYPKISPTKGVYIGNREPKFLAGLSTTFKYKNFSVGALLNGRVGGHVVNVTGRGLVSSGMHKSLEVYRGRQVVWDGVVEQADGTFVKNTTPIVLDYTTITNYYAAVSSNFLEDGSFLRLSYVTLAYDFSKLLKSKTFRTLQCSLTGTNLFLLTKYTGSDPQANGDTGAGGTGSAGIDNYQVPSTRGFNFTISAEF
ncbi:MAG: SusC/RagA family TonB-linked outer membrane protein [Prevotellaceae bacterium]|nr:SusC/RagA family TonB-linked outer membrane protein [Prevotellaceae bacterium]